MLDVTNFVLRNGATADLRGIFADAQSYAPFSILLENATRAGFMRSKLPPQAISVTVGRLPPPVIIEVEMPTLLLPNRWQIALVRLTVVREIVQLEIKITGIRWKPAPLRGRERIVGEGDSGLVFANLPEDVFELHLPILPGQSGVMRIEAWVEQQQFANEVQFTVSDFLEMKLIYRTTTKVAQISAFVTSPAVLIFTAVQFSGDDGEPIEAKAIGIPLIVGRKTSSAMFVMEKVPESGVIFAQQEGLQPFSLHLNVDKMADDAFTEKDPEPTNPQTVVIPLTCTL
jgi:hypothetical protein